jgi:CheY-like chemotaxis protein
MTPQELRFLRALAHELRNVFAPIRNAAAIVQWKSGDDKQLAQSVGTIQVQVQAGIQLLDKLRDVAQLQSGEFEIAREPVSLRQIVQRGMDGVEYAYRVKKQRIDCAGLDADVTLRADPERLVQVLVEVLTNASKFSAVEATVQLRVARSDDGVRIEVADTGTGLAPDRLETACQAWSRFDTAAGAEAEDLATPGLGVGLAIAAQIMRLHDGRLWLESAGPDRGCKACLLVPWAAADQLAEAEPVARSAPVAGAARIHDVLVVDDAARVRETLGSLLTDWGYAARVAADGQQAIEAVRARMPDLVLMDLHMPGLTGFETARALRREWPQGPMKLVLLSGDHLTPILTQGARAAGFDDWIDKAASVDAWQDLFQRLSAG